MKLVCPLGCGRKAETVHDSDEIGHLCPKAKDRNRRLVWLVPVEEDSQ